MNARIFWAAALALAAAMLPVQAQTGEDVLRYGQRFPAVDARMTGLAGAGVAGIADWGAAFANPAGLGLIRRSHAVGSLGGGTLESDAVFEGEALTATASRTTLGSAAYVGVVPVRRGSLVLGVGYNQTAGFDRELSFGQVGTGPFGDVFEEGERGELSFVGAVEVAPRVLFGASLNLVGGEYQFEQFIENVFPEGEEPLRFLEADLGGVNVRAGLAAEVSAGTRLGLAVETPTYFRIEEEDEFGPFEPYSITTPWRLSGGLAYDRGGLLLAADIEFVDWSQARLRPSNDFVDANFDLRRSYSEVLNTRFGAEYDLGVWAVRAGAAFQPDPLREEFERLAQAGEPDLDRLRSTYTVGFSLKTLNRIALDVAYAYTEFEDRVVFDSADAGALVVSEDVVRNRFVVGVRVAL
ncbi:MAG: hypothetical protein AAGI91_03420 [Bacteroidota bacterium]